MAECHSHCEEQGHWPLPILTPIDKSAEHLSACVITHMLITHVHPVISQRISPWMCVNIHKS